jgi:hypothetical protein
MLKFSDYSFTSKYPSFIGPLQSDESSHWLRQSLVLTVSVSCLCATECCVGSCCGGWVICNLTIMIFDFKPAFTQNILDYFYWICSGLIAVIYCEFYPPSVILSNKTFSPFFLNQHGEPKKLSDVWHEPAGVDCLLLPATASVLDTTACFSHHQPYLLTDGTHGKLFSSVICLSTRGCIKGV